MGVIFKGNFKFAAGTKLKVGTPIVVPEIPEHSLLANPFTSVIVMEQYDAIQSNKGIGATYSNPFTAVIPLDEYSNIEIDLGTGAIYTNPFEAVIPLDDYDQVAVNLGEGIVYDNLFSPLGIED